MEILKTAELQDFFDDECVTAMQKKITRLDRAPSHTAVIYPIPLWNSLALLLTLPDGMKYISVPVESDRLGRTVTQFRKSLQSRWYYGFWKDAMLLYDWMIRPVETILADKQIDTLVIAPDSVLRMIPFAALHDGEHFLIEKYAIATVPALTLTDSRQTGPEEASVLLSGLSQARENFSPLPNVPVELRNIREIMGGTLLQDESYTIDNLTSEFRNKPHTIVHIATHGHFGGSPKETFLLAYDGRLNMDHLERLISIGRFRDRQVELLTLSACQTAVGDDRAALGLAGIAVKAGARSAMASLWLVDDEATSVMISEFYRSFKAPDISKAKALQNAQKGLIVQKKYQHPIYWAPFMLIGNWL